MAENGKRQGHKPEWDDLPRRRCANCPVIFKPVQPHQKFHNQQCKDEYHRNGGSFVKVKALIEPTVRKYCRLEDVCPDCKGKGQINKGARLGVVACEKCIAGRVLTPFGRDVLKLLDREKSLG
jgi:hypothetical protein